MRGAGSLDRVCRHLILGGDGSQATLGEQEQDTRCLNLGGVLRALPKSVSHSAATTMGRSVG